MSGDTQDKIIAIAILLFVVGWSILMWYLQSWAALLLCPYPMVYAILIFKGIWIDKY